jgi:hypothetical protein
LYDHIHKGKEKEEEAIIVYNPARHSAFAGHCSIRWYYLYFGGALLSPPTRLIGGGGDIVLQPLQQTN